MSTPADTAGDRPHEFAPRDLVVDDAQPEDVQSVAVVLGYASKPAGDYTFGGGVTVAGYRDVPADEPVVEVAYVESLDRYAPGWRDAVEQGADLREWLAQFTREWRIRSPVYGFPECGLATASVTQVDSLDRTPPQRAHLDSRGPA